jgi:hypothetical protein
MPATIHQLFPKTHQPEPESFANMLRRLADQYEAGEVAGISIVVTGFNGQVTSHYSDDAPALKRK